MDADGLRLRGGRRRCPGTEGQGGGIARRLIVILAEGVDGSAVRSLVDAGQLPYLSGLIEAGASGDLARGIPSPVAGWASIATAVPAHHHGLVAPMTVRRDGAGIAPAGMHDWAAPPFWRPLADAGHRVALVNVPGTIPAVDAGAAICVDPRFFALPHPGDRDWPLAPRCVSPSTLRDALRDLRIHPAALAGSDTGGLPPEALVEAGAIQSAALHILISEAPELLVVAHPIRARAPGEPALRFLDLAIGTLLDAAGEEYDLLLVAPDSFVLAVGPDFGADSLLHGVRPEDVGATILARYNLPPRGGRPLSRHAPPLPQRGTPPVPPYEDEVGEGGLVREARRQRGFALAQSALAWNEFAVARAHLDALLRATPDDPALLLPLGQCHFYLERWEDCLATGAALLQAAPEHPWGAMMQGAGLLMTGRGTEAAPLLALAEQRATADPVALCCLGALALHAGEVATAHRHYAAALAISPRHAGALAGVGLVKIMQGDLAGGESALRSSLAAQFFAPAIHRQLAVMYRAQGREAEAAAALAIAREQSGGEGRLQ